MYIEKRWFVPAALTLLLLGAIAVMVLVRGSAVPWSDGTRSAAVTSDRSGATAPAPIAGQPANAAAPADGTSTALAQPADVVPAARPVHVAGPAPVVADRGVGTTAPEEVVAIGTVGSEDTQINTRGFGDVGLQFDDVKNTAPITIVHVSSQGNNNTTNVNIGNNNEIVSNQDHLQSNRSDGSQPVTAASTAATTPG